jgi:3-oxoacyl-[acyl-carrier protein] reductase
MSGRIIVVGGSGGIGAAFAAREPGRTVVWSRRGGVDATDPAAVRAALAAFTAAHGAPAALLHCVGEFDERPLLGSDLGFYRQMIDSNLTSAFVVAREVVPAMCAAGRGRVVFFAASGTEQRVAQVRAPLYFAAKAALCSMARSLALEVAGAGVTVNVIQPGVIRHPTSHAASQDRVERQVPLGRPGRPEDLFGVLDLLLGPAGAYVTGEVWTVDGGLALRGVDAAGPGDGVAAPRP